MLHLRILDLLTAVIVFLYHWCPLHQKNYVCNEFIICVLDQLKVWSAISYKFGQRNFVVFFIARSKNRPHLTDYK